MLTEESLDEMVAAAMAQAAAMRLSGQTLSFASHEQGGSEQGGSEQGVGNGGGSEQAGGEQENRSPPCRRTRRCDRCVGEGLQSISLRVFGLSGCCRSIMSAALPRD